MNRLQKVAGTLNVEKSTVTFREVQFAKVIRRKMNRFLAYCAIFIVALGIDTLRAGGELEGVEFHEVDRVSKYSKKIFGHDDGEAVVHLSRTNGDLVFYDSRPKNEEELKHPSMVLKLEKIEDVELDAYNVGFLHDSPDNYTIEFEDDAIATDFYNKLRKWVKFRSTQDTGTSSNR